MERRAYLILLHENEWKIKFDGRLYGPYASRQAAIGAAMLAAGKAGKAVSIEVFTDAGLSSAPDIEQDDFAGFEYR